MATLKIRKIAAPQDRSGVIIASIVAAIVLLGMLTFETQSFAQSDGYRVSDLGAPSFAHIYKPWAYLAWMSHYEHFSPIRAIFGEPVVAIDPREPAWARIAFAGERHRLPWELGLALALFVGLTSWLTRDQTNSDLHGAARWATNSDIRRSSLTKAKYGIVLGQTKRIFGRLGHLLVHNGTQNVLALGPPGEGKTDGIARPTLVKTWRDRSAIIFDPADELTRLTASVRAKYTKVMIFDPRNPKGVRFNPFANIRAGDPGAVDAVRGILAAYFLDRDLTEMSSDASYFEGRALALATAVVSHVIELGKPTFEEAARYVVDPTWESDGEMCESLLKSRIPYVQETGAEFARMSERQRSPFISSLNNRLELFRLPDVARATSACDIAPEDLRREPTTLYLVVREKDQAALNPLMRMLLTLFLQELIGRLPREGEQRILLMIDEFPLLKAPVIAQELATMRKYWIHAVLLAQTLSQIRNYYGPQETVSGMCDVRVFFPSVDTATQQAASDNCGLTTRWAENTNRDSAGKTSRSSSEVGRPLLYPSELADIKAKGEIIVYKKGECPIRARPVQAHRDRRFLVEDS